MSLRPMPYSALYSASKVFDYYMTEAVALEKNTYNIDFLCLKPMYIDTPMVKDLKDKFNMITPKQCVDSALDELGYDLVSSGHWRHKILSYWMSFVPMAYVIYKLKKRTPIGVKVD
jgi:short-subunit dehydrogenase